MGEKKVYVAEQFIKQMDERVYKLEATNAELMQQLREKEARIARIETGYDAAIPHIDEYAVIRQLSDILNEAPQQSLAAIRADAVEEFAEWSGKTKSIYCASSAKEYAANLRAEGK